MSRDDTGFGVEQVGGDLVPRRREDVFSVEIDGDTVIYDPKLERSHVLNSTAALIWELLDGATALDQLAGELAEAFGVGRDTVLADVVTLVGELTELGLLEGRQAQR